jgi:hypothetical protein
LKADKVIAVFVVVANAGISVTVDEAVGAGDTVTVIAVVAVVEKFGAAIAYPVTVKDSFWTVLSVAVISYTAVPDPLAIVTGAALGGTFTPVPVGGLAATCENAPVALVVSDATRVPFVMLFGT